MCKAWEDQKESGRQEGKQEAVKESLVILINLLKESLPDLEYIYNAVVKHELYEDMTQEQVKECYYMK